MWVNRLDIKIYVPHVMKLSLEFVAYHMLHDNMNILKQHSRSHQCILHVVNNEILFTWALRP